MEAVWKKVPRETIYSETGIQFLFINTIYQLYSEIVGNVGALQAARRILFIPDLISFWLSGSRHQERTVASASQRRLDEQDVPAEVRMGEADDDSRHHRSLRGFRQVRWRSEPIRDEIGVDFDHGHLALAGDAARCLAHQ